MILGNFFFLILCVNRTSAIVNSFSELLVNSSISQAATRIVQDIYMKDSSAVVFTAGYVNELNRQRQSDLVNEILQGTSNSDIKFRLQEYCHISSSYPEEFNLIFIDSYEGFSWVSNNFKVCVLQTNLVDRSHFYIYFSLIFQRMSSKDFDYTGFYTIILTESYRDQYTIITRGIF